MVYQYWSDLATCCIKWGDCRYEISYMIYNEDSGSFSFSFSTGAGDSLDELFLYQLDLEMLEYERNHL